MSTSVCKRCTRAFVVCRKGKGAYCSRVCAGKAVGARPHERPSVARSYACAHCRSTFTVYHKQRKFCSRACTALARRGVSTHSPLPGWKDRNQGAITATLMAAGARVLDCSRLGRGAPDLVVAFRGDVHLIEVKNPANSYGRRGFNARQAQWAAEWRGASVHIAYTAADALRAIGAAA